MIDFASVQRIANQTTNRFEFWQEFITYSQSEVVAEVGVFRGVFAEKILRHCTHIKTYTMVDPWRHLVGQYNEVANVSDDTFDSYYKETLRRTDAFADKRVVMRGTTQEVIDQIPDESLDFIYIDGDHTLEGITIDMIKWYPKVKPGGFIGGDDFGTTIFQMPLKFEPSPIFPWVVYFAKSMDAELYGLPHWQFLLVKPPVHGQKEFVFHDLTGGEYFDTSLKSQIVRGPLWYIKKQYISPIYQKVRRLISNSK